MNDGDVVFIYSDGFYHHGIIRIGNEYLFCHTNLDGTLHVLMDDVDGTKYPKYDHEHAARHALAEDAGEQGWRKIDV